MQKIIIYIKIINELILHTKLQLKFLHKELMTCHGVLINPTTKIPLNLDLPVLKVPLVF